LNLKKYISLVVFAITFSVALDAQNLPTACANSRHRYGIDALPGSIVDWNITGGVIEQKNNDSIDVKWDDNSGINHTISYREINSFGCQSPENVAYVIINKPYFDLGATINLCSGEAAKINVGSSYIKYRWNDGTTSSSLTTKTDGKYWVEITDSVGCSFTDTVSVIVHQLPTVTLDKNISICAPETYLFEAKTNDVIIGYEWFNNTSSAYYQANEGDDLIWVKVTDTIGCVGYDSTMLIACNISSKIPNAFTPGGGDQNEVWRLDQVKAIYPNVVVKIYDRWGRLVFVSSRGYDTPWDGTSKGKILPMDTYYYVIDLGNGTKEIVGSVAIIR
jgi:gliding motility-associated-like protein